MLVRLWRNWNLHIVLGRMWNRSATVDNRTAVPRKDEYRGTMWLSMYAPSYLLNINKNIFHTETYIQMLTSAFFAVSHKVKIFQMFTDSWKDNAILPGILFNIFDNKTESSTDTCNSMGQLWKCYTKWKKPIKKTSHFYMVPFLWTAQKRQA